MKYCELETVMVHIDGELLSVAEYCDCRNGGNPYLIDLDKYGDWTVVAENPYVLLFCDQSNEAICITNYDYIRGMMRGDSGNDENADYAVIHNTLILNPRGQNYELNRETAEDFLKNVRDYPLLDEQAYWELEYEAWRRYAPMALDDEMRGAADDRYSDDIRETIESNLAEFAAAISQHLHYSDGFSGEYAPQMLDIIDAALSVDNPDDYKKIRAIFATNIG